MNQEQYQQAQQNNGQNKDIKAIFHEAIRDKNDLARKLNSITLSIKTAAESKTASEDDIKKLCSGLVTKHDLKQYTKELDAGFHTEMLKGTDEDLQRLVSSLSALLSKLPQNEIENRTAVANMINSLQNIPHFASSSNNQTFGSSKKEDKKEPKREPKKRKPLKKEKPDREVEVAAVNARKLITDLGNKFKKVLKDIMSMHESKNVDVNHLKTISDELLKIIKEVRSIIDDLLRDGSRDRTLGKDAGVLYEQLSAIESFIQIKIKIISKITMDPVAYGAAGKKIAEELLVLTQKSKKEIWTNIGILGLEVIYYHNVQELKRLKDQIKDIASQWESDTSLDAGERELLILVKNIGRLKIEKYQYLKEWDKYASGRKIDSNDEYLNNIVNMYFFHEYLHSFLVHVQMTKDLTVLGNSIQDFKKGYSNITGEYEVYITTIMSQIGRYIDLIGDYLKE